MRTDERAHGWWEELSLRVEQGHAHLGADSLGQHRDEGDGDARVEIEAAADAGLLELGAGFATHHRAEAGLMPFSDPS